MDDEQVSMEILDTAGQVDFIYFEIVFVQVPFRLFCIGIPS